MSKSREFFLSPTCGGFQQTVEESVCVRTVCWLQIFLSTNTNNVRLFEDLAVTHTKNTASGYQNQIQVLCSWPELVVVLAVVPICSTERIKALGFAFRYNLVTSWVRPVIES